MSHSYLTFHCSDAIVVGPRNCDDKKDASPEVEIKVFSFNQVSHYFTKYLLLSSFLFITNADHLLSWA